MTVVPGWAWRAPPNWPPAPPGWAPPPGWLPAADWPAPPPGWQFWVPAVPGPATPQLPAPWAPVLANWGPAGPPLAAPPQPWGAHPSAWSPLPPPLPPPALGAMAVPVPGLAGAVPVSLDPATRRSLVLETWFVMVAFLLPSVTSAVVLLVQGFTNVGNITRFPDLVHNPLANMLLGILAYLPVAAVVPIALLLLTRTGQPPRTIGLGRPRLRLDVVPGVGLAAASFGAEIVLAIVLAPLLEHVKRLMVSVPTGHVPAYYVIWGLCVAFTTAVAEEVLVNGYLITRLAQLGWSPKRSLLLSITLRTSYHVYYGLGFLFTVPFGLFVTMSFQKHRRLNRAIAAHFLYDAVVITISVLAASAVFRLV